MSLFHITRYMMPLGPYLHVVSIRHLGEMFETPYEVLKHVKRNINNRYI